MPELLLELFSEEIPARMQARAADDLQRLVTGALKDAGLAHGAARAYVTPRRLVLVVEDLPEKQPDLREEKRGPRVDAPEKAIEGFLNANGLTRADCEERVLDKGTFLFAVIEKRGVATSDLLGRIVEQAVADMPWQKSMRWGSGQMKWVRPLERILCVFAGKSVFGSVTGDKFVVEAPNVEGWKPLHTRLLAYFENFSSGHRFLAPEAFEVASFADFENKLRDAFVILDREERKSIILAGAEKAATAQGLTLRDDPGLLDEVAGLVEWPVVLSGEIDAAFMDVPDEVLITSMRSHQKYFSLLNADGSLAPRFVVVANTEAKDGGKRIVAGNERVLRARLSDAKFFWDQDRKEVLESRVQDLAGSVFHAKLGTMAQKAERITALAGDLAPSIRGCEPGDAMRAARLAKADLVTQMVFEFPELQGTMGRYYALNDGEDAGVADAIAEHYSPAGPNDSCPTAPLSVAVALADKLDTLVGFFAIDEKPTGSRDPYALRRAALGIIRLILENGLRLPLTKIIQSSFKLYDDEILRSLWVRNVSVHTDTQIIDEMNRWALRFELLREGGIQAELLDFFADRLKVQARERGIRHDVINAVFAVDQKDQETPGDVDLVRVMKRVDALQAFLETDDGKSLLEAYRRAANIVSIEQKKDGRVFQPAMYVASLSEGVELVLSQRLRAGMETFEDRINVEDFVGAMAILADLREPIDAFFTNVRVNSAADDLRDNRLALLSYIRSTMDVVADFSLIES